MRKRMSNYRSKKNFRKTASRVHKKNHKRNISRGGYKF